ncbi:MAG: hypothetical protein SH817_08800 [Leptospira sp.]|nr:hypothetical protein [Leptospira sp.]
MSEPVLLALLFADRIITEDNHKKGIIGTFNRFMAQEFPVIFPPWGVYIGLTNLTGKHSFELILKNMDNDQIVMPVNGEFESSNYGEMIELPLNFSGVLFPSPGKHILSLLIDNDLVGSRILSVEKVNPPNNN